MMLVVASTFTAPKHLPCARAKPGRVAESRFAPAVLENELVPLVRQVLQITDQLPALFQSVSEHPALPPLPAVVLAVQSEKSANSIGSRVPDYSRGWREQLTIEALVCSSPSLSRSLFLSLV